MKDILSQRLKKINPSLTVLINVKAKALRAEGRDVLVLAAGEPDFDTPKNISQAAVKAIDEGQTRYVPGKGTPALQRAIIDKFFRDNNLSYNLDEIMVGVGGKHIIYNAMMATLNPEDEVIIPAPYWVSYPDIVLLAEGKPSQAAGVLEPVLAVFPGSFAAQKLMAQIQRRMGQWEAVAEHAGRAHAIPHTGRSTDALYVEALVRSGRETEARAVVAASPGLEKHKQVRELLGL